MLLFNELGSTDKAISASAEIRVNTTVSWPPTVLPRDAQSDYPQVAQLFAFGAQSPACDA